MLRYPQTDGQRQKNPRSRAHWFVIGSTPDLSNYAVAW
jgi:hypothetical protein